MSAQHWRYRDRPANTSLPALHWIQVPGVIPRSVAHGRRTGCQARISSAFTRAGRRIDVQAA